MTIFMGINTGDFAFAAIDTKTTVPGEDPRTDEPKMNLLNDYSIGFATVGAVLNLSGSDYFRVGLELVSKINNYPTLKPYDEIINDITYEYYTAYKKQVPNKQPSIVIIFGYHKEKNTPFLYECRSDNGFTPTEVSMNHAYFRGSQQGAYKAASLNVYKNLVRNNEINLQEWAKKTFDAVPDNNAVDYPLLLRIYKKDGKLSGEGDIVTANTTSFREEFKVYLPALN